MVHHGVGRRAFLGGGATAAAATLWSGAGRAASADLRLLTWEGYADDQWVRAFEAKTGARVSVSYTGSVDEIFAKMTGSGGADFDVIAIETSTYRRLTQEKLVLPVDFARVPNAGNLLPALRSVSSLVFGGQQYGVPFAWGSIPLIYDRKAVPDAPRSWSVMTDQRYAQKVIVCDDANNNVVTAALVLGLPDPFNLDDRQMALVKAKLLEQKRLVSTYYAGFDDGVSIFAQGGVALMMSMGEPQVGMLRKRGVDAALTIPQEGAIGWIDCWAISAGVRDKALAHAWIDAMLDRRVGNYISTKTGYGNSTDDMANQQIGMTYADKLKFLNAPESFAKRIELWNEVKATPV